MSEAALVRNIVMRLRERFPNALVVKLSDRYTRGLPDVLCVGVDWTLSLFVLAIEAKTETGRVSPIQQRNLDLFTSLAARALSGKLLSGVVRSIDDLEEMLTQL